MALTAHRRAVGVFSTYAEAERALSELRDSGFPMDRVSVITKDREGKENLANEHLTKQGNKADEGAAAGAATGGALGTIAGLLVGLGAIAVPGVGPVLLAGATATTLATTLSGAAIGAAAGGLIGALIGLGVPEERARVYNDRVSQGHYLVMVEGSDEEIRMAESALHRQGIQEWGIYDIPHSDRTATTTSVRDRDTAVPYHDETVRRDDLVDVVDHRDAEKRRQERI